MSENTTAVRLTITGLISLVCILLSASAYTQEDPFTAEALKLRTALHYDSALGAPLDSLVRLYTKEKREEELVGLYQAHIAQYPDDAGAKAVLARILTTLERPEADEFIQSAARQHPTFPHLQYILSHSLKKKDDARSLEALSTAIDLETSKTRQSQWLGELLDRSTTEKGRELATTQLQKLLMVEGQTGPTMLSLGQVMLRHQFWELGLLALNRAISQPLNPEQKVEANVLAAKAETALGKTVQAGNRLDKILAKLAPDHHRRNEVMSLRVSVIASEEERFALLDQSRKNYEKTPEKETAILDYAEILIASGLNDEALKVLKKGSADLPESIRIETLAIEQVEKRTNSQELIDYLDNRLEIHPSRTDLRYKLVKAHYEKDDPLAAQQDFDLVLASLEGAEKSARILDLARFLRSTDHARTALKHYEAYLKLEPTRLDVTRELCEVYLEEGLEPNVKKLLANSSAKGVEVENLLDLSQFLIEEQFFGPAETILKQFIDQTAVLPFEPGLALARVQSELGKGYEATSLLQNLREQTDTPARYKSWLNVGLIVNDNLGTVDSFFEEEQGLFTFADKDWTVDRIEKFLYLCEAGERRQLTSRVASAIQKRLGVETLDRDLKIKLRQLLVKTLEKDPSQAAEVEAQLSALATEDPERSSEYELQRALLYHNVQRPDLAIGILEKLNLEKVTSPNLLRNSYRMLMEFGDRKLAGDALAAVTALEPSDLFSWEKRLALLAVEGNEDDFRTAIRNLLQGVAQRGKATEWRQDTTQSLQWHLLDSYWRSIAAIVAQDSGLEEALPLLDAAEREAQGTDLLWIAWSRAYLYSQLNRKAEKEDAVKQLQARLDVDQDVNLRFPDGLAIPLKAAMETIATPPKNNGLDGPSRELPLLGLPKILWGFEVDQGARVLRVREAANCLLVLDDRGQIYKVDPGTGKLVWKKYYGVSELPLSSAASQSVASPNASVRKVRQLIVTGGHFLLSFNRELRAYSCADGSLSWKAGLPPADETLESIGGALPAMQFDAEGDRIVIFDPYTNTLAGLDASTGKLIWETTTSTKASKTSHSLVSLNTGISVKNGRLLVYGKESGLFDLNTGDPLWSFTGKEVRVFPITLREQREDLSEEELVTLEQTKPKPVWIPLDKNSRRHHVSHLSKKKGIDDRQVMSFLNYPGSLLAPAVDWAKHRLITGESAHATLADDFLWLMDSRGLRMITLNLPIASQEFEVQGTFLGEESAHAWVLNEEGLVYINGTNGQTRTISTEPLGTHITGTVVEGRVYLRGSKGIVVYNATSGKEISDSTWDTAMLDYLETTSSDRIEDYTWQGTVKRAEAGYPAYCFPFSDVIRNKNYFTVFGSDCIVAIADQ
ncbi:MAG: PQQ-binding-like beta-propeller repeat protein [Verrucomicrobiales bacterium]|nr:PQQ-binding-like beta-propeller repeat protein [Verrucomicrobiales bacterium]